jgi:hypothetical protein
LKDENVSRKNYIGIFTIKLDTFIFLLLVQMIVEPEVQPTVGFPDRHPITVQNQLHYNTSAICQDPCQLHPINGSSGSIDNAGARNTSKIEDVFDESSVPSSASGEDASIL